MESLGEPACTWPRKRRSPSLVRVWLDGVEPRPEKEPTVHQHATRLLLWLQDNPTLSAILSWPPTCGAYTRSSAARRDGSPIIGTCSRGSCASLLGGESSTAGTIINVCVSIPSRQPNPRNLSMKKYRASRPTKRAPTKVCVGDIVRELEHQTEEVAAALLGEPSRRSFREFRWGRHGSLWLCCAGKKRGRWYDHERGEGGDLLDLIARERYVSLKDAIIIASDLLGAAKLSSIRGLQTSKRLDAGAAERQAIALRLWHQSVPIDGTSAENYFAVERQLAVNNLCLVHVALA
jgi:hypothetical protein